MMISNPLSVRTGSLAIALSDTPDVLNAEKPAFTPPKQIQLLPAGMIRPQDGRGPFSVSDAAAVIKASTDMGRPLAIDFDHQIDHAPKTGGTAPAAGWIEGLEADKAGAIYANVTWTDLGRQALAARRYRFISPVFTYDANRGNVVKKILRAGLTNNPALVELPALAACNPIQEAVMSDTPEDQADAPEGMGADMGKDTSIADRDPGGLNPGDHDLGSEPLAATADKEIKPPSNQVPFADYQAVVDRLLALEQKQAEDAADAAVTAAMQAGKIQPALRDWARGYACKDPDGFQSYTGSAVPLFSTDTIGQSPALMAGGAGLMPIEAEICRNMGLEPGAYKQMQKKIEQAD